VTPLVVVLSAPSGGGKTTITQALLAGRKDIGYSVSATTRTPRPGERDGDAYHFLSREEFQRRWDRGEFLESAEYAGERYGTLKSEVDRVLAAGRHVVLDIEVQGARAVRRAYPPPRSVSIFIVPPSAEVLIERLRGRNTETGETLARRLDRAIWEVQQASEYEHLVVNDVLADAVRDVGTIITEGGRVAHRGPPGLAGRILEGLTREAERLRRNS